MKHTYTLIVLVLAVFLVGCQQQESSTQTNDDTITIVTTLYPLYEFAKEVGGNNVEVTLLLPPGAEPHAFEPTPSDIRTIQNSDVFVYIGEGMEPWAHDILEGLNTENIYIIEAMEFSELLASDHEHKEKEHEHDETDEDEEHEEEEEHYHDHGAYDPHVWLSFENDQAIARELANALSQIKPEYTEEFTTNAQNYVTKLQQLDASYTQTLSSCQQNEFLVGGHNFFGYIQHEYNIEGISAIENLEPNTEATPQRIKEIADIANEHNIHYILTEVLVSTQMADALASEVGAQVLVFNPAANLPKEDFDNGLTFIEIMEDNLNTLSTALKCQ